MSVIRGRLVSGNQRGALAAEIAIAVPILAMLLLAGIEITRYVILNQKTERAAATVADLVSQAEVLRESDMLDLFEVTDAVMTPFDDSGRMQVIVSSIGAQGGAAAEIYWQRQWGSLPGGSNFGSPGGVANLPTGFVVREGENVIAVEVFYDFDPAFAGAYVQSKTLYKTALFRPRYAPLDAIRTD